MRRRDQITSILLLLAVIGINAEAPPGHVTKLLPIDKSPPKYEYGYDIEDNKGEGQGKLETRDGIYALGRYYVQGNDAKQSVQYYADDWGYHPWVEYSNVGPHSKAQTQLLLGVEAVKALATKKFVPGVITPKQHITDALQQITQGRTGKQQQLPVVQQPQVLVTPQPQIVEQAPQVLLQQQPPQVLVQQQLPQVLVQPQPQQPPQVLVQQQLPQVLVQPQPQQQPPQVLVQQQLPHPQVLVEQPIAEQPQQLVYLQQQQEPIQQQEQPLQLIQENLVLPHEKQQIIFADRLTAPAQTQQLIYNSAGQELDEATLNEQQQNIGGFGTKINVQVQHHQQTLPPSSSSVKLLQTTQNLVSGEDVLNINQAIDSTAANVETQETSTAKSIVTEYSSSSSEASSSASTSALSSSESVLLNDGGDGVEITNKGLTTLAPPLLSVVTPEPILSQEPIIVADLNEKSTVVTASGHDAEQSSFSSSLASATTATNSIGSIQYETTQPSTVLVTPRPVSTNFLAPITAGVQLQQHADEQVGFAQGEYNNNNKQNYLVEIQKSVPIYLGKIEYQQHPTKTTFKHTTTSTETENIESKAADNIELSQTLLNYPLQHQAEALVQPQLAIEEPNQLFVQQLPESNLRENFIEIDQQQAQGIQTQIAVQNIPVPIVVEKQVPYPVVETKIIEKPVEITKVVNTPYPVQVPVPVPVEKIVEKPVHIPKPYPVEKIVERPIHVPVEVTKYIDRPYPVQVPVKVPYPVDRVVEKIVNQPYPVEVRVPVEVQVPVAVERIVEKKVPVPHYIEKPVAYEKIVEKPVPHYIDRPYPVEVKVPVQVPQPYVVPYLISQPVHYQKQVYTQQSQHNSQTVQDQTQAQQHTYYYTNPYSYAPTHDKGYLPPKQPSLNVNLKTNNGYLPPVSHNCNDQQHSPSINNNYYTIKTDDYIGLLPPKLQSNNFLNKLPRKFRNARSNFNNNLRLEYGFMPPLIPSLEIDEHGQPIEKEK